MILITFNPYGKSGHLIKNQLDSHDLIFVKESPG